MKKKEPSVFNNQLNFNLAGLDGKKISSDDKQFVNKVLFITLWGTWCPPCLTEIPTFNSMQNRYRDYGLVIIAIAFERNDNPEQRREKLLQFAEKHKIEYMALDGGFIKDFDKVLPVMKDVKGFPVEILVGRSGKVVDSRNGYGYSQEWAVDLEDRIKQELDK